MNRPMRRKTNCGFFLLAALLAPTLSVLAQEPVGPQTAPPTPVYAPQPAAPPQRNMSADKITLPAGTRLGVVLENGLSTRNAKSGDSVYMRTSFPITQNNRIVVPVGSYIRGELVDVKRPGRIKGRGEFRLRLNTMIFPNGYTVDLLAVPRSADGAGKETTDSEGKVTGPGGKGKDAQTIAETTATGAGIGAIADGAKGLGIGSGIGAAAGLAAVLSTRGPDAHLPRGTAMDVVIERELTLDGNQIQYTHLGQALPTTPQPIQQN
jgi:hypothetical protein